MANAAVSNVFQIFTLISIITQYLPQAFLNYRLQSTRNLSTASIILWTVGGEISLVYLVWTNQLLIISVAYSIATGIALFIACQIKYYEQRKELSQSIITKTRCRLLTKRLQFLGNYILLLTASVMNALGLYYIFELTKSYSLVSQLIGSIIPPLVDSVGFIPQIIMIIRVRSADGYSFISIITELGGSICGIISVCILDEIDIVPLISFVSLVVFELVMTVLKFCFSPCGFKPKEKASLDSQTNANTNSECHEEH